MCVSTSYDRFFLRRTCCIRAGGLMMQRVPPLAGVVWGCLSARVEILRYKKKICELCKGLSKMSFPGRNQATEWKGC